MSALALTLGTAASTDLDDERRDRRKLEAIEMNAAGDAGVVRTIPELLGEPPGAFHFGAPTCKGGSLGATTLEQLHVALRTGQLVTIDAREPAEATGPRCIRSVTFWAPAS